MSITYPLTMPTSPTFRSIRMRAITNHGSSRSAFSFKQTVQYNDGMIWAASISLPVMKRIDAEPWIAFLLKLNGPYGTFYLQVPTMKTPQGTPSGAPTLATTGTLSQSVATAGWTPGAQNILKAGDMIQIGERLFKNLNDVNADGSGNATLDIWPKLNTSLPSGTNVITSNPKGLFRLPNNEYDIMDIGTDGNIALAFDAVEAI